MYIPLWYRSSRLQAWEKCFASLGSVVLLSAIRAKDLYFLLAKFTGQLGSISRLGS
jgi:hypothetical protein